MPFDFASFVNPNQFSDAASLSGFDKPMKGIGEAVQEAALASMTGGASAAGGVAPPDQSFGNAMMDYGKKAIAPTMQKFDKASNVVGQVGQGQFGNAFNAATGQKVQQQVTTPQYDYSHEW